MLEETHELQIRYWEAYHMLHPMGDEREDMRMAGETSTICAALGHTVDVNRLIPFTMKGEKAEMSVESMIAKAKSVASAMGA